MKGKRILFYVPGLDVVNNGVYYSQVFGLARYMKHLGAECMIAYSNSQDDTLNERNQEGIALLSCPLIKRYVPLPFLSWKLRRAVVPVEERIKKFAPTHVYVRDFFAALAARKLIVEQGARFVFSCRGAGMAEGYKSIKEYVKEGVLRFVTWRVLRRADHVNVVCERLKGHLRDFYRYRGPISILPCCVMEEKFKELPETERMRIRRSLEIPLDAKVVIYSGGMGWYQCTDELLRLFKDMHEVDSRMVFLILTQSQDFLTQKIMEVGLPSSCFRTRKCQPTEVADYLQCADAGVIIRKNDMVNQMASPVKIGEYLASGLPIVVSPWIGDVGALLQKEDFAFMYTSESTVEQIVEFVNSLSEDQHEHARTFAQKYYTYEGNSDGVRTMFED